MRRRGGTARKPTARVTASRPRRLTRPPPDVSCQIAGVERATDAVRLLAAVG